ncbi:hypothetical protein Y032_0074g845 [Ancylostoma ceylanicum]|uniref:Uncharacterized protein n=1 Tax=Ancylostoma ceylanicum TaxID=53326 RepID=A0A016TWG9_9BILA|nr:hypothetical protein Y032_0074g845 [Ancylostoma ceylanicum]
MQRPWPSSSNNFSAIARRLLLNRQPPERKKTPPVRLAVVGTQFRVENPIVCLPGNVPDSKPTTDEYGNGLPQLFHDIKPTVDEYGGILPVQIDDDIKPTVDGYGGILPVQIHDVEPFVNYSDGFNPNSSNIDEFTTQPSHHFKRPFSRPTPLCRRIRHLDKERFIALHAGDPTPVLGGRSKVLIRRVRQFFEEVKKVLGDTCEGTIFNSTVELTAWACGVPPDTVTRVGVREEFIHELFPRKKKKVDYSFAKEKEVTLKRYKDEWGDIIRDYVKNKMSRDTDMTSYRLHAELCREYKDFPFGRDTLYTLVSALGVKFGRVDGKRVMTI